MRFVSYTAGLIIAALIVLAPASRADMIELKISDGTKTYDTGKGDSFTGVSLPTFTLDGVTIKGAAAVVDTSDGYAVNFNTSSVSGTETTGKTITITVTDYAFPGEVTSFQSIHGYSVMVGSSSLYKAHSTVDGTSDSSTTAPIGGGGGLGALTTVHTPTDPSEIVFTATLQSFKPFHGITPSISGGTLLTVVPEPNAMLIGLLGVPCMGAVVYLARRRSAALAGMVA